MTTTKKIVERPVQAPAEYTVADIAAMQALERGEATPDQQKHILAWLVHKAAQTHEFEYRTNERDHAFASGRRFVGLQILKMLQLNPQAFTK